MLKDYYLISIEAKPPEHLSAYHAFLLEQILINELLEKLSKPKLFKNTVPEFPDRPPGFCLFFLPTKLNYYDFVSTLEKMLSGNIRKKFFRTEITRGELSNDLGTIKLLEGWLKGRFPQTGYIESEIISPLEEIRWLRQTPAHQLVVNEYDPDFFTQQNTLMMRAYKSLWLLREILRTDPAAEGFEMPSWTNEEVVVY